METEVAGLYDANTAHVNTLSFSIELDVEVTCKLLFTTSNNSVFGKHYIVSVRIEIVPPPQHACLTTRTSMVV